MATFEIKTDPRNSKRDLIISAVNQLEIVVINALYEPDQEIRPNNHVYVAVYHGPGRGAVLYFFVKSDGVAAAVMNGWTGELIVSAIKTYSAEKHMGNIGFIKNTGTNYKLYVDDSLVYDYPEHIEEPSTPKN